MYPKKTLNVKFRALKMAIICQQDVKSTSKVFLSSRSCLLTLTIFRAREFNM